MLPARENAENNFFAPAFTGRRGPILGSFGSSAHRIHTDPPLFRQPSIVDLLTALPLLLSLDRSDYAATLNGLHPVQAITVDAPTQHTNSSSKVRAATSSAASGKVTYKQTNADGCDTYGDAATTAVVAALRTVGTSAWQTKRRRLRRAALDAFFCPSLPAQISARNDAVTATSYPDGAAASGGCDSGVHHATLRLLAHTRAVMATVSVTQAHLVDLFAEQILQHSLGTIEGAVTVYGASTNQNGEQKKDEHSNVQSDGQSMSSSQPGAASAHASPHSIMKTLTWPMKSTIPVTATKRAVTAAAASAVAKSSSKSAPCPSPTVSIAEQLLYVILRTSVAANTPLRQDPKDEDRSFTVNECFLKEGLSCLHTSLSQPAESAAALLTPSSTNTASSTGSLIRKKPRTDTFDGFGEEEGGSDGVTPAYSRYDLILGSEADSIRHHSSNVRAGQGSTAGTGGGGDSVLPYEPLCWLGPSTIALVERSEMLRRQQRWTFDLDPVIEATIAGEGADQYCASCGDAVAAVNISGSFNGRRNHWAPTADVPVVVDDADVLASFMRDSAFPFTAAGTSSEALLWHKKTRVPVHDLSRTGVLHWSLEGGCADDIEADPAVQSLFAEQTTNEGEGAMPTAATSESAVKNSTCAGEARESSKNDFSSAQQQLRLPACRTPFVSCSPLYDPVVYARVYVALHRCTVGVIDPYELTYYDTQGGPNFIEICVRPEFYASTTQISKAKAHQPSSSASLSSLRAHSGLASMLRWGCRCGTLLLRLHRLCEVADDDNRDGSTALRASFGNYGRCAVDTLRVLLCLLRRQIWELGDRMGGWHRLSFAELVTAQQRLRKAVEQVEALAAFFMVPSTTAAEAAAAAAVRRTTAFPSMRGKVKTKTSTMWDPVAVLRDSCSSALLVSRLHQLFTTRHANALGQDGSAAAIYSELQHESVEEWPTILMTSQASDGSGGGNKGFSWKSAAATSTIDTAAVGGMISGSGGERERIRKDLLSGTIDAIGLLLCATLRPFNAMLHRWLTAGEIVDPYDEFFVVPSHGQTHSGFMLDLSPQRLPVFVSNAAARDLLHAGVSLRVLRTAATHLVCSAQKDARRLQGLAEVTEAAAEDFAEKLHDTQTLQCAIERFVERLVRGAPTADGVNTLCCFQRGTDRIKQTEKNYRGDGELKQEEGLPLPPRVDVLSAYGTISWWRQHYQACTQVLLEAVEEAEGAKDVMSETRQDEIEGVKVAQPRGATKASDGAHPIPHLDGRNGEAPSLSSAPASPSSGSSSRSQTTSVPSTAVAQSFLKADEAAGEEPESDCVNENKRPEAQNSKTSSPIDATAVLHHHVCPGPLTYSPGLAPATASAQHVGDTCARVNAAKSEEDEEQSYITVFINSSDEDDNDTRGDNRWRHSVPGVGSGLQDLASTAVAVDHDGSTSLFATSIYSSASSIAMSSSVATTSVLGLRDIAGSKFSTGTTVSSNASSRGTIALYGAITEELRQVALLEQRTEALAGQSRQALCAEFQTQLWRRRREMRLVDWKAQRLSLRLRRVRAMEGAVDELRELYGIRSVGCADAQPQQPNIFSPKPPKVNVENGDEGGETERGTGSLLPPSPAQRFVIPLRQLPPALLPPPVVLYAEDTATVAGEKGKRRGGGDDSSHRVGLQLRGKERPRRTSFAARATIIDLPGISTAPPLLPSSHCRSCFDVPSPRLSTILLPPRTACNRSVNGLTFSHTTGAQGEMENGESAQKDSATGRSPQPVDVHASPSSPRGRLRTVAAIAPRCFPSPVATHTLADSLNASVSAQKTNAEAANTASLSNPVFSNNSSVVRQLRDVSSYLGARNCSDSGRVDQATAAIEVTATERKSANSSGLRVRGTLGALVSSRAEEGEAKALDEQWYRTTAVPVVCTGDSAEGENVNTTISNGCGGHENSGRVRRDELGYAHPDSHYVVADINDDDFLLLRTGPRSYARHEAEAAALARLAAGRAALDRCTVDAPDYLHELTCAAHTLLETPAEVNGAEGGNEESVVNKDLQDADISITLHATSAAQCHVQLDRVSAEKDGHVGVLPTDLADAWRDDDPQGLLRRHDRIDNTANNCGMSGLSGDDCTSRLWSWTPAEAHRWYFDHRVPLHRVLTNNDVDAALLARLPLSSDETEALQCCGGYYRALGQYTSSYLTHKALQLTLLPPYGSLYRLTTQFLDVCLLQKSAVAVRIVDTWVAAVDVALEMMAEREEAAMVAAVVAGDTHMPAPLASLTDAQQGLDLTAALASLNTVFQREWAGCVENGDSTVKLEWRLSGKTNEGSMGRGGGEAYGGGGKQRVAASPLLGSTQNLTNHTGGEAEGEDAAEEDSIEDAQFEVITNDGDDSFDGAAPPAGWHHHDPAADVKHESELGQRAEEDTTKRKTSAMESAAAATGSNATRRASPIQRFLAELHLVPVSPWCSGAWLLPDRTTHCLGGVCRTLLFWKSVERVVLHTWRAGMKTGLSSVFFFCTTVRQVLLSTLQEQLWHRLTELTATYRERLRFEAGVLYTYRALESFTVDHERFLQDCEFYTLCGPVFQRSVQPLLRAMMREVEVAERALRFAHVSIRVAQRQYMTTFHSMVSGGSSSDDNSDEDNARGGGSKSVCGGPTERTDESTQKQKCVVATKAASTALQKPRHVFTPSCLSRRGLRSSTGPAQQSTPWYMHALEDALAQHQQGQQQVSREQDQDQPQPDDKSAGAEEGAEDAPISLKCSTTSTKKPATKKSKLFSSSVVTESTLRGDDDGNSLNVKARSREVHSASAYSSTTTISTSNTTLSAMATLTIGEGDEENGENEEENIDIDDSRQDSHSSSREDTEEDKVDLSLSTPRATSPAAMKKKKRKRRTAQAAAAAQTTGLRRRSIIESATMNTTPIYAAVLSVQQQQKHARTEADAGASAQKRNRSAGVNVLQSSLPSQAAVNPVVGQTFSSPTMKRHRDQQQQQHSPLRRRRRRGPRRPRLSSTERQERREKLRNIAQRKIAEETEHQRRLMRDVITRRLRRFAALTQSLRDALNDIIAREDLAAQAAMPDVTENNNRNDNIDNNNIALTAEAAKELHGAQRKQMTRFTYLSATVRRLDALVEAMASQV